MTTGKDLLMAVHLRIYTSILRIYTYIYAFRTIFKMNIVIIYVFNTSAIYKEVTVNSNSKFRIRSRKSNRSTARNKYILFYTY